MENITTSKPEGDKSSGDYLPESLSQLLRDSTLFASPATPLGSSRPVSPAVGGGQSRPGTQGGGAASPCKPVLKKSSAVDLVEIEGKKMAKVHCRLIDLLKVCEMQNIAMWCLVGTSSVTSFFS